LFYVLAWRDLSVRYKQTMIGAAWAVIRPLLTMVVFTVIFGRIAGLPSDGSAPYPLMVFAGMLPWTFFATSLNRRTTIACAIRCAPPGPPHAESNNQSAQTHGANSKLQFSKYFQ
jgi:ABC-type polysaccharide/polyol phosphate export permease